MRCIIAICHQELHSLSLMSSAKTPLLQKRARLMPCALGGLLLLTLPALDGAEKTKTSWSFRPLLRPAVPAVQQADWCRDPLDRFIMRGLEKVSLTPNKDADRHTLIRRATFDLTGLPPTENEIRDFVRDPGNDDQAMAKLVDRLLQSERFGERWGRHWLDVVRYADSVGRTMNAAFPFARKYRDYVIDAFNKDKPYNRFISEQLAGDLLTGGPVEVQRESRIATGFLTLASVDLGTGVNEQFKLDQVDDQIDVTSRAFMGLTVSCARCHDHKTDPISQEAYYGLAGVFYSTEVWQGQRGKGQLGANGYVDEDALITLPSATLVASNRPGVARSGGSAKEDEMSMMEMNPKGGYPVIFRDLPDRAMGVTEGELEDCAVAIKGDPFDRGDSPKRGEMEITGLPKLEAVPRKTSGRIELARWITTPTHPLTARVMTNRIWQHLFGRGIVRSVDDFGLTGEEPTDPELLDHLAVRFVESGWSVKKFIRAIMLSRTYRLSSTGDGVKQQVDGANDRFWRMNLRRLEVEALRDSMFYAAGTLTFDRPNQVQVAGFGGKGRDARLRSLTSEEEPFRSVYLPVLRSMLTPMQETFDFPDPSQIKGQREVTTVAPQSLFFLNSEMANDLARTAAIRLLDEDHRDDRERINAAYLRLLGRPASIDEVEAAVEMMDSLSADDARKGEDKIYRWSAFIQALMSCAEFRYLS